MVFQKPVQTRKQESLSQRFPQLLPIVSSWQALAVVFVLVLVIAGISLFLIMHLESEMPHQAAGEATSSQNAPERIDLPVYPGAQPRPKEAPSQESEPSSGPARISRPAASYFSEDGLDQVAAWYREKLDPSFREERGKTDALAADHRVFVSIEGNRMKIVALQRQASGTNITFYQIDTRQAQ